MLPPTRDIAVGIATDPGDSSITAPSRRAAQQAAWLASRTGGELALLHSTWIEEEDAAPAPGEAVQQALEELAGECRKGGVEVTTAFTRERPWLALVQRALRNDTDFVFVAHRNRDHGRLIGTNTGKLLRKCPCPVWSVSPDSELLGRSVLAATDLSPVGTSLTRLAAGLAEASGAELHVVHAWQRTMQFQLESASLSAAELRARTEALEKGLRDSILTGLAESGSKAEPILHIGCTSPDRAILEGVDTLKPDLLVMGTISRTGVPGMLVGNTAERVLERVPCSLLTMKPDGFVSPVGA